MRYLFFCFVFLYSASVSSKQECAASFGSKKERYRPFDQALEYVLSLKLPSAAAYELWSKSGSRPKDIPSNPYRVYEKDWRGWGHYLGTGRVANGEKKFRPFEEALEYMRALKLSSARDYKKWSKSDARPMDIPSNPHKIYKEDWRGWGYYLGTGHIANGEKKFRPFEEALEYVHLFNFSSAEAYKEWSKSGKRPKDIPGHPHIAYKKQWRGWGYYLGTGRVANGEKKFRPFEEALEYVRALDFSSVEEYSRWSQSDARPPDIPTRPDKVYQEDWKNWGYYLGTGRTANGEKKFRPFEEALEYVRALKLSSAREYHRWSKSGSRPRDIPSHPHMVYKKQWRGFDYYLREPPLSKQLPLYVEGRRQWSFKKAKKYVRSLGFESIGDFLNWLRSEDRPGAFPIHPQKVYAEWAGAGDFLGLYWPYEKAKKYIHTLFFDSKQGFKAWSLSDERLENVPLNPQKVYADEWEGWSVFLGLGQ